jgi:hypothetical protein
MGDFFGPVRVQWWVNREDDWRIACVPCGISMHMPRTKSGRLGRKTLRNVVLFLEKHCHGCKLSPPEAAVEVFKDDPAKVVYVFEVWGEMLADRLAAAAGAEEEPKEEPKRGKYKGEVIRVMWFDDAIDEVKDE